MKPYAVCVAALAVSGCFPPMACVQTARLVDKGSARLTPYYAAIRDRDDDALDTDVRTKIDEYGALIGVRISDEAELQLRYDHFEFSDDLGNSGAENFVAFGPKFAVVENRLALLTSFGAYVDADLAIPNWNAVRFVPGLVYSYPLGRHVEPIASGRIVVAFDDEFSRSAVVNLGVSLSAKSSVWAVIPEVGYAWRLGGVNADPLFSASVGLSLFR